MLREMQRDGQGTSSGNRTSHARAKSRFRADKSRRLCHVGVSEMSRETYGELTPHIITHIIKHSTWTLLMCVCLLCVCVCVGGLSEVIVDTIMNTCAHPPINHGCESLIHEQWSMWSEVAHCLFRSPLATALAANTLPGVHSENKIHYIVLHIIHLQYNIITVKNKIKYNHL